MSPFADSDWKALLAPQVEPLRPEHLDKLYESVRAAFKDDPLHDYLLINKLEDSGPIGRRLKRLTKFQWRRDIKRKLAFTVDKGEAVIISTPPSADTKKPSPIDRTIDKLLSAVRIALLFIRSREQLKRVFELENKAKALLKEKFGEGDDAMDEYYYIDAVATNPPSQGQGYASALLNTIHFSADLRGRPAYLLSSTPDNVPFYESHGYETIGEVTLGDKNPKWEKDPITVPLMVRKAKDEDLADKFDIFRV